MFNCHLLKYLTSTLPEPTFVPAKRSCKCPYFKVTYLLSPRVGFYFQHLLCMVLFLIFSALVLLHFNTVDELTLEEVTIIKKPYQVIKQPISQRGGRSIRHLHLFR